MSANESQVPLSWLVLEQYALGELDESRRHAVEARLASSPVDRARLASIDSDASALPALPAFVRLRELPAPVAGPTRQRLPRRWIARRVVLAASPVLAAAAALLLWLRPTAPDIPPERRAWKGGELAVRVVSERGGDALDFSPGERLKLLVTCPPSLAGSLAVVMFQGEARYTPLPEAPALACGNQVPWPGAFQLDGTEPVHVCLARRADASHAASPGALGEASVCTTLKSR